MYIREDTFELLEEQVDGSIEADDLIAPAVSVLNRKGYRTSWSCSGHADRNERPQYAYITFWFGETSPEYLPEGWYWESDGHMEYEYKQTDPGALQEEITEVMQDLKTWADGLPELYVAASR